MQNKKKQQKLWDLYLIAEENGHASITPDELDKKLSELNQQKNDIERQLENHEGADKDYYISVNLLLELAQNAGKLFQSATVEQKRKILKLVYWNLELVDGKAQYSLRKPFDLLLDSGKTENWLGRQDSNLGMAVPKTAALPLGYAPPYRQTMLPQEAIGMAWGLAVVNPPTLGRYRRKKCPNSLPQLVSHSPPLCSLAV